MLSYNDALAHQQPSSQSCVVCHDLVPTELIIWHKVRLSQYADNCPVVPICLDCADLFHDVRPTARPTKEVN